MQSFYEMLIDKAQKAKDLHLKERRITLESVDLVLELENSKAWHYLNMSVERFAEYIGLTPSKYWKRAKVARLFQFYPQFRQMFERGETEISQLTLVWGKITPANSATIFDGIKGKSKREVEALLSRINCYGELSEERPTYDIYVRMTEEDHELLSRARDVLAHGGHVPSNAEIIAQALDVLLDKKDPIRKAERAAARADRAKEDGQEKGQGHAPGQEAGRTKKEDGSLETGQNNVPETYRKSPNVGYQISAPGQKTKRNLPEENIDGDLYDEDEISNPVKIYHFPAPGKSRAERRAEETRKRLAIPMTTRYTVWVRDEARCTFVNPDGSRCEAMMMLEIDHIKMVCEGGGNEAENLRLRCRQHNQLQATMNLGYDYRDLNRRKLRSRHR